VFSQTDYLLLQQPSQSRLPWAWYWCLASLLRLLHCTAVPCLAMLAAGMMLVLAGYALWGMAASGSSLRACPVRVTGPAF